jgi:UDP-N-acetyl-D-galactosamine dehydrogenase
MSNYVAGQVVKLMSTRKILAKGSRVLVLGLTFKENCPDLRNTRVIDIVQALQGYNTEVDVHDPWVNVAEAEHEYAITPMAQPQPGSYDAVIIAVGHRQFVDMGSAGIRAFGKAASVIYDVKCLLPRDAVDGRL